VRRRRVLGIGLAALLVVPERVSAQQAPAKIPRVGILASGDNERAPMFDAFRAGLRHLGYVEGRNIILEFRFTRGDRSLGPKLAAELLALPVDVIVSEGLGPRSAVDPSGRIPIVSPVMMNPVELGSAASLARPGGNITGFTLMHTELNGKRVELLHNAFPQIATIAALVNPAARERNWLSSRPKRPPGHWAWGVSARSRSRTPRPCARCVRRSFPKPAGWSLSPTGCSMITTATWLPSSTRRGCLRSIPSANMPTTAA